VNYAVLVLAATAVGAGYGWQSERTAHANTKAAHAEYIAKAERTARELAERNRSTEQELQNARENHDAEAAALRKLADRRAVAAVAAGQRLQDAAADAAERSRAQCAGSAPAELRDTAQDPARMLSIVLGEIDDFAGAVAANADDARAAGSACQRQYNAVREAVNGIQ
jgi:hypothetical protein